MADLGGGNNSSLEQKIDKLINAMELLVDATERRSSDNSFGHTSDSRFVRRVMGSSGDMLYQSFDELTYDYTKKLREDFHSVLEKAEKDIKRTKDSLKRNKTERTNNAIQSIDLRTKIDNEQDAAEKDRLQRKKDALDKRWDELHKEEKELRGELTNAKRSKHKAERDLRRLKNDPDFAHRHYDENVKPDSDKNLNQKWDDLSPEEKKKYKNSRDRYKKSERKRISEENEYIKSSEETDELRRRLSGSGIGNTSFGRFGQRALDRKQRAEDIGNFGDYLNKGGGAGKYATKLFGSGKMGSVATKGLGAFGKALGFASKLLRGPFINAIMMAVDAIHIIGDTVGEWKKYTADMIKFQAKEEQLQYENSKATAALATESAVADVKYQGDMTLKMMEVQGQNLIDAVTINNQQYLNALQTGVGTMMQGINATAYQAAENQISASADMAKYELEKRYREGEQARYEDVRTTEFQGTKQSLAAQKNIVDVEYLTRHAENDLLKEQARQNSPIISAFRDNEANQVEVNVKTDENNTVTGSEITDKTDNGSNNPYTGQKFEKVGRLNDYGIGTDVGNIAAKYIGGEGYISGVQAKATAMLDLQNQSMMQNVEARKDLLEQEFNLLNVEKQTNKEIADTQLKYAKEVAEKYIDTASEQMKIYLKVAQMEEKFLDNADKISRDAAFSMGITDENNVRNFEKSLIETARDVASKFGKSIEEVTKAQNTYAETTGRNKALGEHDYGQLFGLGVYLGDEGLAAQFGSEMEIFNHGIEDSVDMLDEVLQNVNKVGLNGRKYTRDLVNNLKLAQKYNFKGGTKELMKMAKWAQQTRFDMGSLSNMLEKVQGGDIEEVIKQSAGFQVLGGHAAMRSDPIGMLYEAWADPQAYAKRMQDMTKGFGSFNRKTGETEFNINESMQIAQIAKLQGRSAEELRAEIIQRNKQNSVNNQLGAYSGFSDEQKNLISNKAEFKNGRWVVKMNDGKTVKDVSNLSETDLENLMPTDHNERMEDYMKEVISKMDKMTGEENREKLDQGLLTINDYWKNQEDRLKQAQESYQKNREEFANEIKKNMDLATSSFGDYLTRFGKSNEGINKGMEALDRHIEHFDKSLNRLVEIIDEASGKIAIDKTGNKTGEVSRSNSEEVIKSVPGVNWGDNNAVTSRSNTTNRFTNPFSSDKSVIGYGGQNTTPIQGYDVNKSDNTFYSNKFRDDVVAKSAWANEYAKQQKKPTAPKTIGTSAETYHTNRQKIINLRKQKEELNDEISAAKDAITIKQRASAGMIWDGVTQAVGKPMLVSADNVTKVHDASAKMVQTDPNDSALFAKSGGPFDVLFNGVFNKVDEIYNTVVKEKQISRVFNKLHESWTTPSAYDKRMRDITRGSSNIGDNVNKREFGIGESMQIAQIAKLRGKSIEEVKNEIINTSLLNKFVDNNTNIGKGGYIATENNISKNFNRGGNVIFDDNVTYNKDVSNRNNEVNNRKHSISSSHISNVFSNIMRSMYGNTITGNIARNLYDTIYSFFDGDKFETKNDSSKYSMSYRNMMSDIDNMYNSSSYGTSLFKPTTSNVKSVGDNIRSKSLYINEKNVSDEINSNANSYDDNTSFKTSNKSNVRNLKTVNNRFGDILSTIYDNMAPGKIIQEAYNIASSFIGGNVNGNNEYNTYGNSKYVGNTFTDSNGYANTSNLYRNISKGFSYNNANNSVSFLNDNYNRQYGYVNSSSNNVVTNNRGSSNVYNNGYVSEPHIIKTSNTGGSTFGSILNNIFNSVFGGKTENNVSSSDNNTQWQYPSHIIRGGSAIMGNFNHTAGNYPMVSERYVDKTPMVYGGSWNSGLKQGSMNDDNVHQSASSNQTMDVKLHGDINLKSPTGETYNIGNLIKNDPMLIRKITELIVLQLNNNSNGGRNELYHNRFSR